MFDFFNKKSQEKKRMQPKKGVGTRILGGHRIRSGFFSDHYDNYFTKNVTSASIDYYLRQDLTEVRTKSREFVRTKALGRRFAKMMRRNIVGINGISVIPQKKMRDGKLDEKANDALRRCWKDWSDNHCDLKGRCSFTELCRQAINHAGIDGEFIFEKFIGKDFGKYGYQLKLIDPELLDVQKNEELANGGEIRLGVEYDKYGRVSGYHFREMSFHGNYRTGIEYRIGAEKIMHCFIQEHADQSRGIPWTVAVLETQGHLYGFKESAIVRARVSASVLHTIKTDPKIPYTGGHVDEDTGIDYTDVEPGEILELKEGQQMDTSDVDYPDGLYSTLIKDQQRETAIGLGVSYAGLTGDLSEVNFSSMRAGTIEERDEYKILQNWLISDFVKKVYEQFIEIAYLKSEIKIGGFAVTNPVDEYKAAIFRGRGWEWVDPQKDAKTNIDLINNNLKSLSETILEMGKDHNEVLDNIARDKAKMKEMGIETITEKELAIAAGQQNENAE